MNCFPVRCLVALIIAAAGVAGVSSQQPSTPEWYFRLRYGGGTPIDAGPLGHCTATFTQDGRVRIESKGRRGVSGPPDKVVFQTDSLDKNLLQGIFQAADAALREKPFTRRGANEDGNFLRLERAGSQPARISHSELNEFGDAPPAILKLVELINGLLPEEERIPLQDKRFEARRAKSEK